jgi:hypothetical protein
LTYANIVATLALVFAMSGGALAASHYLITSTKQISPKVLKQLKGKSGAAGKEGAPGKAGGNGTNGTNGTGGGNGESVTSAEVKVGDATACNALGGSKFTVGGSVTTACNGKAGKEGKVGENGKEGSPWTAGGTLPSGKTETGAWGFSATESHLERLAISFPIPLTGEELPTGGRVGLQGVDCEKGASTCHVRVDPRLAQEGKIGAEPGELCAGKSGTELTECETPFKQTEQYCKGTVAAPSAEPGNLCIYERETEHVAAFKGEDPGNGSSEGAGATGMILLIYPAGSEGFSALGTWAVTEK